MGDYRTVHQKSVGKKVKELLKKGRGTTVVANFLKIYLKQKKAERRIRFWSVTQPVFRIRSRINMFLGLQDPDPDPLVRGMDPDPNPDPSIIMQKSKKNLDSFYFVTLFDF